MTQDQTADENRRHLAETRTPRPSYAPAAMALGIMMLFWGIVSMWIMSAAGAGLMMWSLWMWINDIRRA